jgi:hypothetical protein
MGAFVGMRGRVDQITAQLADILEDRAVAGEDVIPDFAAFGNPVVPEV